MKSSRGWVAALAAAWLCVSCTKSEPRSEGAPVAKKETGAASVATRDEIKLGQVMPYSGPASAYGTIGKLHQAFFAKLNREGGIDGKKVSLVSLDDGYSPPRAVEQVRKLVEQDKVSAVFNAVGTPSNTAIRKYLNDKRVPQLFVSSGASKWADPKNFPWTIGFNPSYRLEGRTYAGHILRSQPAAKIAVLYQADDFGKDVLHGLREGLGDKADKMIVAEATYETTDPTIDSQLVTLKASKADVVLLIATPKFAAQAVRKVHDLDWKATRYLVNVAASIGAVLEPAGLDKAKGLITVQYVKDPNDPRWADDPAVKEWYAFMKAEYPAGDTRDAGNAYAYVSAQTLVQVLKQCKGDYSAENLMKQAASLKDFAPGLLLPGIRINTSADDFELFDTLQLAQFDGHTWAALSPGVAEK